MMKSIKMKPWFIKAYDRHSMRQLDTVINDIK